MRASRQKGMDQTRIISTQNEEQPLDPIQLKTLEKSYRDWDGMSSQSDGIPKKTDMFDIFFLSVALEPDSMKSYPLICFKISTSTGILLF